MRQLLGRVRRLLGAGDPPVGPVLVPYPGPPEPVRAPAPTALPIPAPVAQPAVVLWFRDGTAAALDPRDPYAGALQTLAARLREAHT